MSAQDCRLGAYQVTFSKGGRTLSSGLARLEQIAYSRVLDAPSSASVQLATTGEDCCGQLGVVDHWNTDMIVSVDREVLWRGPVRKVTYRRDVVSVEAIDMLGWLQRRVVPEDLDFVTVDVSQIFEGIWNSAVVSADPPYASLELYTSGVAESRKIEAASNRFAWSIVQEMLDAGLDVTTFGSRIVVGLPAYRPFAMTDADVQGNIEVVKDGDEFANRAISMAARDIVGIYPAGPRAGSNGYPLVETVLSDSQLQDQQSAENAAKSRYEFSAMGVRRVRADGGLVLLPSAKLDFRRTLAGQFITFSATQTCYPATETMRLGRLDVLVEQGRETATIDLQPIGGLQGLDSVS